MSVTEPCSAPRDSARSVSGHRNPLAAKTRLSPATTAPAIAARRSVRLVSPAYSTYTMHDSMENQANVCTALITRSVRLAPVPVPVPVPGSSSAGEFRHGHLGLRRRTGRSCRVASILSSFLPGRPTATAHVRMTSRTRHRPVRRRWSPAGEGGTPPDGEPPRLAPRQPLLPPRTRGRRHAGSGSTWRPAASAWRLDGHPGETWLTPLVLAVLAVLAVLIHGIRMEPRPPGAEVVSGGDVRPDLAHAVGGGGVRGQRAATRSARRP